MSIPRLPFANPRKHRMGMADNAHVLSRISQMTLVAAYDEVTISPMNTGENEPQAAEILRIQWVKQARRRSGSGLTARSSWSSTARPLPLMQDWSRTGNSMKPWD